MRGQIYRASPEVLNPFLGKVVSGFVAILAEAESSKVCVSVCVRARVRVVCLSSFWR